MKLTDDIENVSYINWSSNEKWVWFQSFGNIPARGLVSFYTIIFDDSTKFEPTFWLIDRWTGGYWISPNFYFLFFSSDGGDCPFSFLRYIDVATGEKIDLWRRHSNSFAIDKFDKLLAVSTECGDRGTFIVDWFGKMYIKVSETPLEIEPWIGEKYSFLGIDYYGYQVFGINNFGALTLLSEKNFNAVSESPDNLWYVLYQDHYYSDISVNGMDLFSENNQFIRTISGQYSFPVAWSPDSKGLYYIDSSLYYIDIPDGNPILIDDCKPEGCNRIFAWIP